MTRKLAPWWRWGLVIAWMVVIFCLSSEPGGESGGRSDLIVQWLLSWGLPGSFESVSLVVRKAAHMTEYAVLAILLFGAVRGSRSSLSSRRSLGSRRSWGPRDSSGSRRAALLSAFAIAAGYAATDEIHQLFIPGRTGLMRDVFIDATGAAIGLALAWLMSRRRAKRHDRESAG